MPNFDVDKLQELHPSLLKTQAAFLSSVPGRIAGHQDSELVQEALAGCSPALRSESGDLQFKYDSAGQETKPGGTGEDCLCACSRAVETPNGSTPIPHAYTQCFLRC